MTVLRFRKRANVDDTTVAIFATLATSRGADIADTCRGFLHAHPNLRPADLVAAFALAHRVVAVFARHLAETDDEHSDGDAA
jgi:hypothetical protein